MNDAIKRYLDAATGFGELTKKRADAVARQLVKQGEAASDQVGDLVDELLDRQRKNREAVVEMVRAETQRAVRLMGLATGREVERLETELAELKQELAATRAMAADSATSATKAGSTGSRGQKKQKANKTKAKTSEAKKTKTAKAKTAKAKTAAAKKPTKKARKITKPSESNEQSAPATGEDR